MALLCWLFEMTFDADQVTSEQRKRLCFDIFMCRMMVLIRFSIASLSPVAV